MFIYNFWDNTSFPKCWQFEQYKFIEFQCENLPKNSRNSQSGISFKVSSVIFRDCSTHSEVVKETHSVIIARSISTIEKEEDNFRIRTSPGTLFPRKRSNFVRNSRLSWVKSIAYTSFTMTTWWHLKSGAKSNIAVFKTRACMLLLKTFAKLWIRNKKINRFMCIDQKQKIDL